jgi:RimJ/RimL family protein N-acetyltransferase
MAAHDDTTPVMMDLVNYSATETLRDGRAVEIRAQRSQDREGMQAAIARFS